MLMAVSPPQTQPPDRLDSMESSGVFSSILDCLTAVSLLALTLSFFIPLSFSCASSSGICARTRSTICPFFFFRTSSLHTTLKPRTSTSRPRAATTNSALSYAEIKSLRIHVRRTANIIARYVWRSLSSSLPVHESGTSTSCINYPLIASRGELWDDVSRIPLLRAQGSVTRLCDASTF